MNIYDKKETNFNNNGYGFLTPSTALITEELNGEYSLSFTIMNGMPLYEYIVEDNIVKVKGQLFRIKTIKKDLVKTEVYAPHIFYDLLNNIVLNTQPTDLTAMSAFEWVMDRADFETPFTVTGTVEGLNTARYVRRNLVEVLIGDMENTIVTRWGCEIERDNFNINLVDRIGHDNNVKLVVGKNIKEIDIVIDTVDQVTRMLPLGFDALMLPEIYVDSPNIDFEDIKIKKVNFDVKYDPEDEDAFHTKEEAWSELRNQALDLYDTHKVDQPTISIQVDWVELSKTEEYKNYAILERAELGDDISVEIAGLSYKTRVLKTIYNVLTDTIDYFEIGSLRAALNYDMTKRFEELQTQLDNIKPTTILENAKNDATDLINTAMGGYVIKTKEELYIMDTDDIGTATNVWRWNMGGLGYSSNGYYGPYELAMTSDGQIVADFITTGTMNAQRIAGLQEVITDILSIKMTQRNGNNLIRNSAMKNGIEYWLKEGWLMFQESPRPPENPTIGTGTEYWYATEDFENYKRGTIYQWTGTEWIETDKQRSDFEDTFIQSFVAEENNESRSQTISNSIISVDSGSYGDKSHNFGMTEEIPLEENQEYLTLSLKLNNNINTGNIHFGLGFVPDLLRTQPFIKDLIFNLYEEWYCITPDEYRNMSEIKLKVKIPKLADVVSAEATDNPDDFDTETGHLMYTGANSGSIEEAVELFFIATLDIFMKSVYNYVLYLDEPNATYTKNHLYYRETAEDEWEDVSGIPVTYWKKTQTRYGTWTWNAVLGEYEHTSDYLPREHELQHNHLYYREATDHNWQDISGIPALANGTIWTWREFYSSYYPTNFTREDFKANYAYFAIAHYPRI